MNKLIEANDIARWANSAESNSDLPLLLKKLIRASCDNPSKIEIPIGNGIYRGGWDGIVNSNIETEFIPHGVSLWEFGTDPKPESKANKDYEKRHKDPLGQNPNDSIFIFVTPRLWVDKENWIEEKKMDGTWRDIKVYDSQSLEEWLNQDYITLKWFGEKVFGYSFEGYDSINNYWAKWSQGENKKFPTQLVTNGREDQFKEIIEKLSTEASLLGVISDSTEESIAFICASIEDCDTLVKEQLEANCIIIHDKTTFEKVLSQAKSLILIPNFEDLNLCSQAIAKGHKVIVPLGSDFVDVKFGTIKLNRLDREKTIKALNIIGYSDEEARGLSKDSGRSVSILRRLTKFDYNKPKWATQENAPVFIPALLVGRWDEGSKKDREVIEKVSKESYENYIEKLSRWLNIPDSPILKIGTKWRVYSNLDLIIHIGQFISLPELNRFKEVYLGAFREINPALSLTPDKRAYSNIYGMQKEITNWCRDGLSQVMILIAVYGDTLKLPLPNAAQNWVDNVIYELLNEISGQHWCSLDDSIQEIAEASPDNFLNAIESSLKKETKSLLSIFTEEQEGLFGASSYHTGMLWAMESLAWEDAYLSRVVHSLMVMAENDPGGNLANRPINTLRHIFLPWLPQTHVSYQDRLSILESLAQKFPVIMWELLLKILPSHHSTGWYNKKYKWRQYEKNSLTNPTYTELFKVWSAFVTIMLKIADKNGISGLIDKLGELSPQDRTLVIDYIKENHVLFKNDSIKIWLELKDIISHHRRYSDKDWAMSPEDVDKIEELYHLYTPSNITDQIKWLFDEHFPRLMPENGEDKKTKEESDEELLERRIAAIQSFLKFEGIERLGIFIQKVNYPPWGLGSVCAKTIDQSQDGKILPLLKNLNEKSKYFLLDYFGERSNTAGVDYIFQLYNDLQNNDYTKEELTLLFCAAIPNKKIWVFLESEGEEIEKIYWLNFNYYLAKMSNEEIECGLLKLIKFERFFTAIDEGAYARKKISTNLICKILHKTATQPTSEPVKGQMTGYDIDQLFDELHERDDVAREDLLMLEWMYMRLIFSNRNEFRKKSLIHDEIAKNPKFYIEIIKGLYMREDGQDERDDLQNADPDSKMIMAEKSYDILSHLDKIPGANGDKELDADYLNGWVKETLKIAEELSRRGNTEYWIGHLLAQYKRHGENWPDEKVCDIVEQYQTEKIRRGFYTGSFNGNGVNVVFGADSGERALGRSEYYLKQSKLRSAKYPFVSKILKDLSDSFKHQSKIDNERAKEDELEF